VIDATPTHPPHQREVEAAVSFLKRVQTLYRFKVEEVLQRRVELYNRKARNRSKKNQEIR
ncbi:unnamed protein product, partial [Amoebophrya sp. A25]